MALFGADFPKGICLLWMGERKSIPRGWRICDGKNGTPNLQFQATNMGATAYIVKV